MTSTLTPAHLTETLDAAHAAYRAALEAQGAAAAAAVTARRAYVAAHSTKLSAGVEGGNEAARKANLLLALTGEQDAVDRAEDALTAATLAVTLTKLDWDAARQRIRIFTGTI